MEAVAGTKNARTLWSDCVFDETEAVAETKNAPKNALTVGSDSIFDKMKAIGEAKNNVEAVVEAKL